jgi:nickel/cobalt exporter
MKRETTTIRLASQWEKVARGLGAPALFQTSPPLPPPKKRGFCRLRGVTMGTSQVRQAATDRPLHRASLMGACLLLIALALSPLRARADTVASLLGNFTINQYSGVQLADNSITVHYAVVFGQLPALTELHKADANGDGVTSQAERDAYVQQLAPEFARQLQVEVDGAPVPLKMTRWGSSLPTEQGGFSLRLDADFVGALPPGLASGTHELTFANRNYNGRFGWHEITIQTTPSIHGFNTNGFDTSVTNGLTEALRSLPASGPLDEREQHLSFTHAAIPTAAIALGPRAGSAQLAAQPAARSDGENAWLQRQTRALIDLISAPHVALHVTLLALLAAFVLGALHAFSPGHGKTIVGAYLIGSRGTPKHAAFLGLTVTITHTLGVFALGFATLFASRFIVPERLFPVLSLLSGLIVLGMGMILLAQRWRLARTALTRHPRVEYSVARRAPPMSPMLAVAGGSVVTGALLEHHQHSHGSADYDHGHNHSHGHSHGHDQQGWHSDAHQHEHRHDHGHEDSHDHGHEHHDHGHEDNHGHGYDHHDNGPEHNHGHSHDHHDHGPEHSHSDSHDDHDHAHNHGHAHPHGEHSHSHNGGLIHSHGGSTHSHAPPTDVTWKSLLALGVSGGLIPCPSAMVLLLAAVALNKTAYGMLLVLGFSVGLAVTLTLVGLAFLYARNRLPKADSSARWPVLLPVASAAAITVVGVVLCFGALQTAQW